MTTIQTSISGIYARSESLVAATRNHDRGRIDDEALQAALQQDQQALADHCSKLTYQSDGMLNWQDLFRPFLEAIDGLDSGALTRNFNTNSFYRCPVNIKAKHLDTEVFSNYFSFNDNAKPYKVTLPGPISFAKMSDGSVTAQQASDWLLAAIEWLDTQPVSIIELSEPYIGFYGDCVDVGALKHFVDRIKAKTKSQLAIFIPFGAADKLLADMMTMQFDIVGVDAFLTSFDELVKHDFSHCVLQLGCINGRNSIVEDPKDIENYISRVSDKVHPKALIVSNNIDLQYVPERIAADKVAVLGKISS